MKILFIADMYSWHTSLWLKYFSKNHIVYLLSDERGYEKKQVYQNVKIIKHPGIIGKFINYFNISSTFLRHLNKFLSTDIYVKLANEVIETENIDIIHAHSLYYGYIASKIKNKKIKIIFSPLGSDVMVDAFNKAFYKKMVDKVFLRTNIITADSNAKLNACKKLGSGQIESHIIQYGVDKNHFEYKSKKQIDLNKINSEFILFSPRGLSPEYNIDCILKALAMLNKDGIKFKCMFAFNYGEKILAKYKLISKKLNISNNIEWLGYIKYEDMSDLYNMSDVVISFPFIDSSPKCVYEALFCKSNVIVSDLEWSYDFLKNEIIRVESDNYINLYESIKKIYINRDFKKKEIEMNYDRIIEYYDYEANMKKIEDIIFKSLK